jgi:endoglycosylceramidase
LYNQTFFKQIHRIIDMCERRGIYVLLEFHQDLFSERYCGNGAPLWASKPISPHNPFRFPFPVKLPFKVNTVNYSVVESECEKLQNHLLGYGNYGVSQAFQDLYTNADGILDAFALYWEKVVTEFKNHPNVIGYELINGNKLLVSLMYRALVRKLL